MTSGKWYDPSLTIDCNSSVDLEARYHNWLNQPCFLINIEDGSHTIKLLANSKCNVNWLDVCTAHERDFLNISCLYQYLSSVVGTAISTTDNELFISCD